MARTPPSSLAALLTPDESWGYLGVGYRGAWWYRGLGRLFVVLFWQTLILGYVCYRDYKFKVSGVYGTLQLCLALVCGIVSM